METSRGTAANHIQYVTLYGRIRGPAAPNPLVVTIRGWPLAGSVTLGIVNRAWIILYAIPDKQDILPVFTKCVFVGVAMQTASTSESFKMSL